MYQLGSLKLMALVLVQKMDFFFLTSEALIDKEELTYIKNDIDYTHVDEEGMCIS